MQTSRAVIRQVLGCYEVGLGRAPTSKGQTLEVAVSRATNILANDHASIYIVLLDLPFAVPKLLMKSCRPQAMQVLVLYRQRGLTKTPTARITRP